jgi:hypothetical protein
MATARRKQGPCFSPFGMTLSNGKLYVANTNGIIAVPYNDGDTEIKTTPEKIVDLPAGLINHHWTKDVIASEDGTKLYATAGSNSNVGENGIEAEKDRAAVLKIAFPYNPFRIQRSSAMSEDAFNMSIRKFLKEVGVTSQRKIEETVREGQTNGKKLKVHMTLTAEGTGLNHVVDGEIELP